MKKLLILFIVLCVSVSVYAEPTDDAIGNAFGVSMQLYVYTAISYSFAPGTLENVTIIDNTMEFSDFDLEQLELEDEDSYKTVSGTITINEDDSLIADLVFSGGSIKKLSFSVDEFEMGGTEYTLQITADGRTMTLTPDMYE